MFSRHSIGVRSGGTSNARQTSEGRRFREVLQDDLLFGVDPAEVFLDSCMIDELKKAVAERALEAHLARGVMGLVEPAPNV